MLIKLKQRCWIEIEVARGHSTQECFYGLREGCGVTAIHNPINLHDNAMSHTAAAVTDLSAPLATGNSGISTVFSQYESM